MSDGADRNFGDDALARVVPALDLAPTGGATAAANLPVRHALRTTVDIALPDRGRFRQHLEQRLARATGTQLALLYVEVDRDGAGETRAAPLDRVVASRIAHALRNDDLVGRLGAGQFACVLGGVPSRLALDWVARRLRAALEAPLQLGPQREALRAHIGIAVCPRDGATASVLLKHADEATFRARAHGAGHAFFDPRLDP